MVLSSTQTYVHGILRSLKSASVVLLGSLSFADVSLAENLSLGTPNSNGGATVSSLHDGWEIQYPAATGTILYPGIAFLFTPPVDWSGSDGLAVDVQNQEARPVKFCVRVESADASKSFITGCETLNGGETATLGFPYVLHDHLIGLPFTDPSVRVIKAQQRVIDPQAISRVSLSLNRPVAAGSISISNARLVKNINPSGIIDAYGQNSRMNVRAHDLVEAKAKLVAEIASGRSRPEEWDEYGGCKNCGFELPATSNFRVAKAFGRWWFVDPNGRPFFSLGVNAVNNAHEATPIDGRESIFQVPPASESRYNGNFSFHSNNVAQLYTPDLGVSWKEQAAARLVDWGFNTLGNWSDNSFQNGSLARAPRLAYTRTAPNGRTFPAVPADKSTPSMLPFPSTSILVPVFYSRHNSFVHAFPDVFSNQFRDYLLKKKIKQGKGTVPGYFGSSELELASADSYCIGLFVDNELHWDGGAAENLYALPRAALGSKGGDAKKQFLALLTKRYKTVAALNAAWGTTIPGKKISQLLNVPLRLPEPGNSTMQADLSDLLRLYAAKYYQLVKQGLHTYLPNKLYLGSRYIGGHAPKAVLDAAVNYVDVLSFNVYRTPEDLRAMDWSSITAYDKPILVSEFNFGAYDSGHFRPGAVSVRSQSERGQRYQDYVLSLLANPYFVGAHVYQYNDQPISGRAGDYEGYNNGFVDSLDLPYVGYVNAVRALNRNVYHTLTGK